MADDYGPWKVLIPADLLLKRIETVAQGIQKYITSPGPPVVMAIITQGGLPFGMELRKQLNPIGYHWCIVGTSSYGSGTENKGVQLEFMKLVETLKGKRVLLVDDIGDTRKTLRYVRNVILHAEEASEVKICTMLNKPRRRECPDVPLDWVGFNIPDTFVAGFGLDGGEASEWTRNLPGIYYKGTLSEGHHAFWLPESLPA